MRLEGRGVWDLMRKMVEVVIRSVARTCLLAHLEVAAGRWNVTGRVAGADTSLLGP